MSGSASWEKARSSPWRRAIGMELLERRPKSVRNGGQGAHGLLLIDSCQLPDVSGLFKTCAGDLSRDPNVPGREAGEDNRDGQPCYARNRLDSCPVFLEPIHGSFPFLHAASPISFA
jgi:hypothetical protein